MHPLGQGLQIEYVCPSALPLAADRCSDTYAAGEHPLNILLQMQLLVGNAFASSCLFLFPAGTLLLFYCCWRSS